MRMGQKMKRVCKSVLSVMLSVVMLMTVILVSQPKEVQAAQAGKSRAIYVVFDNSGSMYKPGNMAWSQATYAMEVFAAMMNFDSGDVMKVFPMHPVTANGNAGTDRTTSITVQSTDDIAQIHNMYTPDPEGTPYTQVNTASAELTALLDSGAAQEGWLVVLTDGIFDSDVPAAGLQEDLKQKAASRDNMYVQFLGMGSEVENVPDSNEDAGLYAQKAGDSAAVINELAIVSNRIFKRNEYPGYKAGNPLKLDVPLSKLIVFAQGSNVDIKSLKNKEGGEVKMESCYSVSCSSTDGAGQTSYVTQVPTKDTSLKGAVAVFADPSSSIVEGEYTLDIEGADSIQVYYEPNVEFGAELLKGGKKVDGDTIEGGSYQVKVGFIDLLSGKFIKDSKLLGKPEYTLTVNGQEYGLGGNGGVTQTVDIQADGDELQLSADVVYLNDYMDHAEKTYKVCTLDMEVQVPKSVALKEIDNAEPLKITAKKNGKPLTKEQWENATVELSTVNEQGDTFALDWDIQKGSEVSTWIAIPKYKDGKMFETDTGKAEVTVDVSTEIDGNSYGKAQTVSLKVKDDRGVLDYLKHYWKQIALGLLLLILILGYIPPFKKRFPRKMKSRPSIECTAEKIGIRDSVVKGNFEKNKLSVFLPYKAEVGRLTFSPAPVKKTARVKAAGGGSMMILNTSTFAGKEDTTFNGMSIPDNYKGHYRISASTIIVVSTPEFTYTCIPNVQRTADGSIKKGKRK